MTKHEMIELLDKLTVEETLELEDIIKARKSLLRMYVPLFDFGYNLKKAMKEEAIRIKYRKEYEEKLKTNRQAVGRVR